MVTTAHYRIKRRRTRWRRNCRGALNVIVQDFANLLDPSVAGEFASFGVK
jgi:hypothetical protein